MRHVRFHELPHSFAVNSIMIGDDVKTAQTNLGHVIEKSDSKSCRIFLLLVYTLDIVATNFAP